MATQDGTSGDGDDGSNSDDGGGEQSLIDRITEFIQTPIGAATVGAVVVVIIGVALMMRGN